MEFQIDLEKLRQKTQNSILSIKMIETIKKSIGIISEYGFWIFLKKSFGFFLRKMEPLKVFIIPYAKKYIENINTENYSVDSLINFVFYKLCGIIKPAQVKSEITKLVTIIKELRPENILEIGTARGGTLFLFSQLSSPNAHIISIDLPGGKFGGGYSKHRTSLYKTFVKKNQKIDLLRVDSHADSSIKKLKELIGNNKLDFLFIDGDHTYDGVKRDFELYSPFVRQGGIIALHDIAIHPKKSGCTVNLFWDEIKKNYKYLEFIENKNQKWAGIGVLYV